MNIIILNQPYRRRVSFDRLSRENSEVAASHGGESGPTPAGKPFPHSSPNKPYFGGRGHEELRYVTSDYFVV